MLNLVEGFDLRSMGHNSADYLHVHVESKKLAYEDRAALYTDPDFFDVPVAKLLSKEYADKRRGLISMESAVKDVESGGLFEGDTIYLATADSTGMMVSFIQSNYRGMGSGLVPDDLGFGFQDRGELFALDPDHPNVYAPGKRPFHTIIPAFVMKDGEPFMSFGVMGGAMQPQGHVQILGNIIDFDMNVQEAGDAPRYRHDGSSEPTGSKMRDGGELHIECGISAGVAEQLRARGHAVEYSSGAYGGYQAIMRDRTNGVYRGASEMRKDGNASGY
jgi:gamma-glutamyltranspeptidase/glutathione hydrolase